MYEGSLGEERMSHMWRYREEADGGIHLGLGTDWPAVMSIDPIDTVYAAVTRSEFDGHPAEGYFRENALTLGETLQAHTLDHKQQRVLLDRPFAHVNHPIYASSLR